MSDAPPEAHVLRFLVTATAFSAVIGGALLAMSWRTSSPFALGLSAALLVGVPAWSMIVAAVGAGAARKARYCLALLAVLLALDITGYVTGWQSAAPGTALAGLYRLLFMASPIVTVMLFAGKRPAVFWMRGAEPPRRGASRPGGPPGMYT